MREINNKLKFLSNADATVYFHAEGAAGIRYLSGHSLSYRLSDAWGNELVNGHGDNVHLLLPGSGEYRLTFIGKNGDASVITLFCDYAVLPYMMPGVVVLLEHVGVFPLLLDI